MNNAGDIYTLGGDLCYVSTPNNHLSRTYVLESSRFSVDAFDTHRCSFVRYFIPQRPCTRFGDEKFFANFSFVVTYLQSYVLPPVFYLPPKGHCIAIRIL